MHGTHIVCSYKASWAVLHAPGYTGVKQVGEGGDQGQHPARGDGSRYPQLWLAKWFEWLYYAIQIKKKFNKLDFSSTWAYIEKKYWFQIFYKEHDTNFARIAVQNI